MKKLFLLLIIAASFAACKKPKDGAPGKDGNANVKSQIVYATTWQYSNPSYYSNVAASIITQDICNSGAVLIYSEESANTWLQLPITLYNSSQYSSTVAAIHSPNTVTLIWTDSDLTQPSPPPTIKLKVVAIASSARLANIDYSNYEQVKAAYNLPD